MTMTRLCTSTWVAARPTPGAAYIVSAMSRDELLDVRGHRGHRRRDLAQSGVRIFEDIEQRHRSANSS